MLELGDEASAEIGLTTLGLSIPGVYPPPGHL